MHVFYIDVIKEKYIYEIIDRSIKSYQILIYVVYLNHKYVKSIHLLLINGANLRLCLPIFLLF